MSLENCSHCKTPTALDSLILFEGRIICFSCDEELTNQKNMQARQQQAMHDMPAEERRTIEAHLFLRQLLDRTPQTHVTKIIIGLNVLVFVLMVFSGVALADPSVKDLIDWGGSNAFLITNGEWWRMLTSTFLHGGIVHLALNMLVLKDIGTMVEKLLGNKSYFLLYFISALSGSLASVIYHPYGTVGVGASGAISGVFGALIAIFVVLRNKLPKEIVERLKKASIFVIVMNIALGVSIPNIDMAAHTGGMVGGFICGAVMTMGLLKSEKQRSLNNALLCLVTAVGLVGWGASVQGSIIDIDKEINTIEKQATDLVIEYNNYLTEPPAPELLASLKPENTKKTWHALRTHFETTILPLDLAGDKKRLAAYMDKRFTLGSRICESAVALLHENDRQEANELVIQLEKDLVEFKKLEP